MQTTEGQTGYCPNCKHEVMMVREEINIPLVVILAIFTSGILVLVYFIIYNKKEPQFCVHCKSECKTLTIVTTAPSAKRYQLQIYKTEEKDIVKFCPTCGVKLGDRDDIKFCALCGGQID